MTFPTVDGVELTYGDGLTFRRGLHWLSFCDGDRPVGEQFLGAVVLDCIGEPSLAAAEARLLGVNPGGEMLLVEVPKEKAAWFREHYPIGKLLSLADIERIQGKAPRRLSEVE